jgi:hypothetical protein
MAARSPCLLPSPLHFLHPSTVDDRNSRNDYTIRAQVARGLSGTAGVKQRAAEAYLATGEPPRERHAAGVAPEPESSASEVLRGIDVVNGTVVLMFGNSRHCDLEAGSRGPGRRVAPAAQEVEMPSASCGGCFQDGPSTVAARRILAMEASFCTSQRNSRLNIWA